MSITEVERNEHGQFQEPAFAWDRLLTLMLLVARHRREPHDKSQYLTSADCHAHA